MTVFRILRGFYDCLYIGACVVLSFYDGLYVVVEAFFLFVAWCGLFLIFFAF